MWTSIVKNNAEEHLPTQEYNDKNEVNDKIISINIFEIYHTFKCIDFIMDIKNHLNSSGYKVLDKENINLTKDFITFLQNNVACLEDDINHKDINHDFDNNNDYDEYYE